MYMILKWDYGRRWLRGALPLRFILREISPQSLRTGSWQEA